MIFIASSWKNREAVRLLAQALRDAGHDVYDFSDVSRRKTEEFPKEKVTDPFDPSRHRYGEWLASNPGYRAAVIENREMLDQCTTVVLLLPCGNDAHADWAYGIAKGATPYVIGHPSKGEWSLNHLWAKQWFPDTQAFLNRIGRR